ncbi:uncharacterized protein EDB91DRAFT_1235985 [Suillus paluster]|uniref:uncharacterized protein n=1 Tax=Suillus paluster TaxID=48578 RepID=UPI001B864FB9|nr:uncharacterized protein EDB91DRAFT_1235985 [Suillus paluster]KAG1747268.1 hypothetical protein EDB91DRAFT_1235985 [Suillus paluster]
MPPPSKSPDDWTPYRDRVEFETAKFLYTCNQMSAGDINVLLDLWAATLLKHNDKPPFADCRDLHKTIDSTLGPVHGEKPEHNVPLWMGQSHDIWYRDPHEVIWNMLANPDYATEMDYQPYHEFSTDSNECQWQDFMSSDWAWNQGDIISKDPDTTGLTFVPVILGSDKTTVSVAIGANDYYPLYVSIGNVCNNVRRAHCDAVAIIGFLAMQKEHASCPKYRKYCWQLFHSSISKILTNLRPSMTKPEVVRFGDGHYWCVIYGLGPYIADYEEQVLLVCIVRSWCPRYVPSTDIHELITLDLLHQLIKGTFKDHLVEWVGTYLHHVRRGFKQWTGDDSKALMKVYLPAIEGHVPMDVVRTFHAFLEFCYLVWCNIIMESTLVQIQDALNRFHHYRKIFESMGVFGAPNGLCSSITKTKHIKAVKEPWRRSSRYKALGQMLVTNQRLDKLAASHIDFKSHGMLNGTSVAGNDEEELTIPHLYNLLHRFLFEQVNPDDQRSPSEVPLASCPQFDGKIQVFNSASSTFYAPSDRSGIGGMHQEHICACPLWRNEAPRYDCVFVNTDAGVKGMRGMDIARVMCFFSLMFKAVSYPCTVVHWFNKADDDRPDKDTGMWIAQPSYDIDHSPSVGIIHIDSIYRAAHLIPIYGTHAIPQNLKHYDSYDAF